MRTSIKEAIGGCEITLKTGDPDLVIQYVKIGRKEFVKEDIDTISKLLHEAVDRFIDQMERLDLSKIYD